MKKAAILSIVLLSFFSEEATSDEIKWQTFNPPGSVTGRGMLRDVVSRCTQQRANIAREPDPITFCHEATHQLNAMIGQSVPGKNNASYVGHGYCIVLPEPRVTLTTVSQYVPAHYRNKDIYKNTFVLMQQYYNKEPLYVLDEFASYCNGMQYALDANIGSSPDRSMSGSIDFMLAFIPFSTALVTAVERHDPGYRDLRRLKAFVRWQQNRAKGIAQLLRSRRMR